MTALVALSFYQSLFALSIEADSFFWGGRGWRGLTGILSPGVFMAARMMSIAFS